MACYDTLVMPQVLPATTIDKFMQLATLLEQAGHLVREIGREQAHLSKSEVDDQAWFWSDEWQAGEREVDRQLANGEYDVFNSVEELFADLDRHSQASV